MGKISQYIRCKRYNTVGPARSIVICLRKECECEELVKRIALLREEYERGKEVNNA